MPIQLPSLQKLAKARRIFEANEPRDLFYRAATELVDLALRGGTSLTVAEALAVLLQTWNRAYYRYKAFDAEHFSDIERLIRDHQEALRRFRKRRIDSFSDADGSATQRIFHEFEEVMGPVGAAKCLHLLAPRFFPLWDRAIAKACGLALKLKGKNAEQYCRFMRIVQEMVRHLGGEHTIGQNPLKAIDEYNYCSYTKGWR